MAPTVPERGTLQCLDDRRARIGGLQGRVELREVERGLRASVTGLPMVALTRGGRHSRRHPIDQIL